MSQKQEKGRKKGGDDNIKDIGNEWEGFREMWMECGNDECDVWMQIKAPDGWSGEKDEFRCGAPNDTAYKRWSCHSELKLLCKLCRISSIYRFFGHAGHADPLDGWRCCSQKRVMSRPIQVRQL